MEITNVVKHINHDGIIADSNTEQRLFLLYFLRRLLCYNDIIDLRSKIYMHE